MIDDAIILAAGSGLRLKPLTNHAPKCLTEVHGVPILENTLRNLSAAGIYTCTIVAGHFAHAIEDTIGNRFDNIQVYYTHNPKYRTTNDMYSLWLAREKLERGVLLIEGDIFFRVPMLERVLSRIGNRSCYFAGSYDGSADEILIETDHELRITSVEVLTGRRAERGSRRYMSAGLLFIQREYGKLLSAWLQAFVQEGRVDVLFDAVIAEHIGDAPLYVSEISHDEWVEIDTVQDLERAERTFRRELSP
jgi:CTP:phosphocholine cytidylyltransferase-like protein